MQLDYQQTEVSVILKRSLIAAAAVIGTVGAAAAADIPMAPPAPPAAPVTPPPAPAFDWSGPYVGAYSGYVFGVGWVPFGVQAGYLYDLGGFVVGIEGQLAANWTIPGLAGQANVNARAGVELGEALLYGEAGVGILFPGATGTWNAGGGIEFAVNNDMTLFAETKAEGTFGGGLYGVRVTGGLNWHF